MVLNSNNWNFITLFRFFFQAAVVSILLYGCTNWTLTKRLKKKLDGNYTRMLRAILNKSWRQYPTRHKLYGHLPPITKTIQIRRTRHAGHCWRSKDELISDVLLWAPAYGQAKAGRTARTYSSYVRIRDVTQKTCQKQWTIRRSGERGSGISMLAARHDDDDDDITLCKHIISFLKIELLATYWLANPIFIHLTVFEQNKLWVLYRNTWKHFSVFK